VFRRLLSRLRRSPAPVSSTDVLRISYAPHPDGDGDPGEVVWTWVPYEDDPKQGKDRPVLVIGTLGKDLAVLPFTSKNHTGHADCIELGSGAWDPSRRVSYVKLDRVLRVPSKKIRREGAALDRTRFDHVVAKLAAYHVNT
jgi:PemK-like, MazF-like toxin of type II toxin-antitoxin system